MEATGFAAELHRLRARSGLTWTALASAVGYSTSFVWKVAHGQRAPSTDLVRRLDTALAADGLLEKFLHTSADGPRLPRPVQLPTVTGEFVGRDEQLRTLDELLLDPGRRAAKIVTIEGAPGVGKTTLAVRWAATAAERFPGGCLFADLGGHLAADGPQTVLHWFLTALGLPQEVLSAATVEELGSLFRSVTAANPVLLVLDDATTAEPVRALLPGQSCAVVLTSRRHLPDLAVATGSASIRLGPLPPADARRLLGRLAGKARIDAEPQAVELIADRCGRLPLALRLAGEQLAARPHLTLRQLAEELEPEGTRLNVLASADLSVRSVIDVSYRMLSPAVARTWRLLAAQPCPVLDIAAVAALADVEIGTARESVARLVEAHLVETARDGRVRLHGLLRVYATERACAEESAEGRERAWHRLFSWYLSAAAAASDALIPGSTGEAVDVVGGKPLDSYQDAISWYEAELASVLALVRRGVEHGGVPVWKLAVLFWPYLYLSKQWQPFLDLTANALTVARRENDEVGTAWCLQGLGWVLHELGRDRDAVCHLRKAARLHADNEDDRGRAWTDFALGECLNSLGEHEEAYELFLCALAHFRIHWPLGVAIVQPGLAIALEHLDQHDEALTVAAEALRCAQKLGVRPLESRAHYQLGLLHLGHGEARDALVHLDHALTLRRATRERWGEADTQLVRGQALASLGQCAAAREAVDEAIRIFGELHDHRALHAHATLVTLNLTA
ncbi:tetratricopeptide repeat protein [Amycolatopsis pigmentata]|uniref:Tetratricopeptide repeat protein n=1 Tax=Amycolatopsis pigmentata TaxID=450801 RepID=A0ABW5FKS3_9PSEU